MSAAEIVGLCIGIVLFLAILIGAVSLIAFSLLVKKPKKPIVSAPIPKLLGNRQNFLDKYFTENPDTIGSFTREVFYVTTKDGLKLEGYFYRANKLSDTTVLCMHGYNSCGEDEFAGIAPRLIKMGYNVCLVNHRSHGKSEGKYIGFGILDSRDSLCWLAAIENMLPGGRVVLYGISMGAATALMSLGQELPTSVVGVISDCGFTTPYDEFCVLARFLFHISPYPWVYIFDFLCKRVAKYGIKETDTRETVKKSKVPILFIHGKDDVFVPPSMTKENYEAATCYKELLLVEGAAHAGSFYTNPSLYMNTIEKFLSLCFDKKSLEVQE